MELAVIGVGGVGGYFGGLLARKGVSVHFVARGRHLDAIRKHGLRVEATSGTFSVRPTSAEADARAVPNCDLVLVCVKNYDLDALLTTLQPYAGDRACFVPLLNGIDAVRALSAAFPARIIAGQCSVLAELVSPGVVRQAPGPRQIVIGGLDRTPTPRALALRDAFADTGVDVSISETIEADLWTKMIYIACVASVVAVTRTSVGEVLACAESRALCVSALEEAIAVARAEGVALQPSLLESLLSRAESLEKRTKFSLLRDLEAGRRIEIDALNGALVRRGREHGLATPVHQFLYAALLPAHRRAGS